jgi:acetyl esterase/lipase
MDYELDPELVPVLAALAERAAPAPAPARGDWKALRQAGEAGEAGQAYLATLVPPSSGVRTSTHFATAPDGAAIELRRYAKPGSATGSAVVYAHGGGMIMGSLDLYDEVIGWYVDQTGVPFVSVGYRRAPEATGTALAKDVFAGLAWPGWSARRASWAPIRAGSRSWATAGAAASLPGPRSSPGTAGLPWPGRSWSIRCSMTATRSRTRPSPPT